MTPVKITVRLEAETVAFLDELARLDDRDRSYLIKQAVNEYLAERRWQIEEIKNGIAEIAEGKIVPEEEMERLFAKWTA